MTGADSRIGGTVVSQPIDEPISRSYFRPIRRPPISLTLACMAGSFLSPTSDIRRSTVGFFSEPAIPNPPKRVARDWLLVAALVFAGTMEWIFNEPLIWRHWHMTLVFALIPSMLWRRTKPLLMMLITFIAMNATLLAAAIFAEVPDGPYTAIFVLFSVYSLFRWGSGRDCLIGVGAFVAAGLLNAVIDWNGVGEFIGGFIVMAVPAEAGALVRAQRRSAEQAIVEVRSAEREQIARELHDSVAHHVSAIAIQAQAGRTVAATNPAAAEHALASIEEAAARTLADMRSMVGSLRGDEAAELAPQPGLRELESLAGRVGGLDVAVDSPAETDVPSALGAAIFRIAQESVTNAVRHATGASRVDVQVERVADAYQLTVRDDGKVNSTNSPRSESPGYGLVGMAERARLLGGTLDAGPGPAGGWLVKAELPIASSSR